jgi:hypothetical protein
MEIPPATFTVRPIGFARTHFKVQEGTPIIDVKPYVPQYDSFPGSKAGWHETSTSERRAADNRFEKS